MRVTVTKAFPYSPHGYDNAYAFLGEQELPDDIAAIALREGWATADSPWTTTNEAGTPFASIPARDLAAAKGLTQGDFTGHDPLPKGFTIDFVRRAIARRELRTLTHGKSADEVLELLSVGTGIKDPDDLQVIFTGETENPDHPGGRDEVLDLIRSAK